MRRSVFAPVAVILLGVLLLLDNLVVGFSAWTPLLNHWPWFLFVWGGFHLQRQVFAYANGRPGPRRLGAGALLVALLICFAGVSGRKLRENDGVVFRGFGVRVQVRDEAFRAPHSAPPGLPERARESP